MGTDSKRQPSLNRKKGCNSNCWRHKSYIAPPLLFSSLLAVNPAPHHELIFIGPYTWTVGNSFPGPVSHDDSQCFLP
jgi:hypothetical protein